MTAFIVALALAAGSPPSEASHAVVPREPVHHHICGHVCRRHHRWRKYTLPYREWLRSTRMCESGGDYSIDTGNGFYGAYQFTLQSWFSVGGSGSPHRAPPIEQDYRAVRLLHTQGRGAWPVCG